MVKHIIRFRKGSSATIDDLQIIFRYLPLEIRKKKNFVHSMTGLNEDTETYFGVGCKVTIEFKERKQ